MTKTTAFGTDEHLIELLQDVINGMDTPMGRIANAKTFNTIKEVIAVLQNRRPSPAEEQQGHRDDYQNAPSQIARSHPVNGILADPGQLAAVSAGIIDHELARSNYAQDKLPNPLTPEQIACSGYLPPVVQRMLKGDKQ